MGCKEEQFTSKYGHARLLLILLFCEESRIARQQIVDTFLTLLLKTRFSPVRSRESRVSWDENRASRETRVTAAHDDGFGGSCGGAHRASSSDRGTRKLGIHEEIQSTSWWNLGYFIQNTRNWIRTAVFEQNGACRWNVFSSSGLVMFTRTVRCTATYIRCSYGSPKFSWIFYWLLFVDLNQSIFVQMH